MIYQIQALSKLFADCNCFVSNSKRLSSKQTQINEKLHEVQTWFNTTKLILNSIKSNYLVILFKLNN